ncbi:MAG: hypothetical protein V4584_07240 [Verrucomicrobiota bacterium]
MKTSALLSLSAAATVLLTACDPGKKSAGEAPPPEPTAATRSDIPILPAKKGDTWVYQVHLEIPADVTSPGAAEVEEKHQRTRTYLGKISPVQGLPEVDCFEVIAPAAPVEREFVEIHEDKVLMRGSMIMRPETTRPMWLDHPVPFVVAGMKPGTESPEVRTVGGGLSRKTQVVARESITVPAGTYPAIRLLMTGSDGDLELRRSIWFSPGTGIIREEKTRYRLGKLIFRETQELTKTSMNAKP